MCSLATFCFFFQAEDGIRDLTVTGVQTCALPICFVGRDAEERRVERRDVVEQAAGERFARVRPAGRGGDAVAPREEVRPVLAHRSEERRVGKESRSRWSPYPLKKKKIIMNLRNSN